MFLDQDHSYDCFDRNNSHWEPSYIDIQSNSFLLGMQRFLLVCKSRARSLSLHLAKFYFTPQDSEIDYNRDQWGELGKGKFSVLVFIPLWKVQKGSWSAWRSPPGAPPPDSLLFWDGDGDFTMEDCHSSFLSILLLKLGLCPTVPNRNVETEFWVKEKKTALLLCHTKESTAG